MLVEVVLHPAESVGVPDKTVVVIDVLRATTSIASALHQGIKEIRVFSSLAAARKAAAAFPGRRLLCGERRCLKPRGFDLGNSPGDFRPDHAGATAFMSTTNGTRAIRAASGAGAAMVLTGALVNAASVAGVLHRRGGDVVLLCAGTDGQIAAEDMLGAGAILHELDRLRQVSPASDRTVIAREFFIACRRNLAEMLAQTRGGRNVIAAGLSGDLDFAARLNSIPAVGVVHTRPLRVIRCAPD